MLQTDLCGIKLKNPIIAASGTFGFGEEYGEIYDVSCLGGIATKGLTLKPRLGNRGQRMWETPAGMLNSVGLQNPGIPAFLRGILPKMEGMNTAIIANLCGSCEEDYLPGAVLLDKSTVDMIELNISCPNVKTGGMAFGIEAKVAYDLVKAVRAVVKNKPLMVKLSPNARNMGEMAKACEEAGADSLSLINTVKGMAIDVVKKRPVFRNVHAGLSGPAIKPIALCMVYEVSQAVKIPVVGMGGITTWRDVLEFIMAGATAVQVGTANFTQPDVCLDMIEGLQKYGEQAGIASIAELRGAAW